MNLTQFLLLLAAAVVGAVVGWLLKPSKAKAAPVDNEAVKNSKVLKSQLGDKQVEIERLQKQLKTLEGQAEQLKAKSTEANQLKAKMTELEGQVEAAQAKVSSAEKGEFHAKRDTAAAEARIQQLQQGHTTELAKVREEALEKAKAELLKREAREENKELDQMRGKVKAKEREIETLQKEWQALQTRLAARIDNENKLTLELNQVKAKLLDAEARVARNLPAAALMPEGKPTKREQERQARRNKPAKAEVAEVVEVLETIEAAPEVVAETVTEAAPEA
jgi:chromosome segregation ATPase